jgi:hypothetical protein
MNPYLYISLFRRQRLNALTSAIAVISGGGSNAAEQAASAYEIRVLADGGTIEAYQCMVDKLTFLFDNP